jgi:hypothetical protein
VSRGVARPGRAARGGRRRGVGQLTRVSRWPGGPAPPGGQRPWRRPETDRGLPPGPGQERPSHACSVGASPGVRGIGRPGPTAPRHGLDRREVEPHDMSGNVLCVRIPYKLEDGSEGTPKQPRAWPRLFSTPWPPSRAVSVQGGRQRLVVLGATPEQVPRRSALLNAPCHCVCRDDRSIVTGCRTVTSWLVTDDGVGEIGEEDKLQKPAQASVAAPGR